MTTLTGTDLQQAVEDAAAYLYVWALKDIPQDLRDALADAAKRETSVPGQRVLSTILKNVQVAQDTMNIMRAKGDDVLSISLMDSTGTIVMSTLPGNVSKNLKQRDYFQAGMRGEHFISGVAIALTDGATSLFREAPVKGADGTVVGVMQSRSGVASVQSMINGARNRIGAGATGLLIDEQGLVIAAANDPSWLLKPIVPLSAKVAEALKTDQRWANNPVPEPLGLVDLAPAIGTQTRVDCAFRKSF